MFDPAHFLTPYFGPYYPKAAGGPRKTFISVHV